MQDNILVSYAVVNLLFLISGVLLLVFALTSHSNINSTPTLSSAARDVVLKEGPGTGQSTPLRVRERWLTDL
jgi:hypothetical protein